MRFWLIVLFVVFGLIPCLASYVWTVKTSEQRAISVRTAEIQNQCTILSNQLNSYQYLTNPSSEVIDANLTQLTNIYNGRVMIINQNLDVIKDTYGLDEGKTMVSENVIRCLRQGKSTSYYDKKNRYVEVTAPVISEEKAVTGVMLASVSMDTVLDGNRMLRAQGGAVLIVVFLVVLSLGILVAGWFVRPLGRITASIENVTEGYESEWLHVGTFSETGQLSDAFNKMLGRLKQLNDSREEFVSNVSHELKTPLTSMKVLADSINSMPDAPKELYQEFMEDITNEIERETKIINDLLSLVKMDKSAAGLNVSSVNINELLEQILKRLQPIADKQKVELVLESFRPVTAEVDEVKITLAITNLVENAIKYNRNDGEGWVHVSLNADHQYFYLKVEDSGIGIPEESLDHIYERFYRVDKSHSREIGGTGLGLAIAKKIVDRLDGDIAIESKKGVGTTVTMTLPFKIGEPVEKEKNVNYEEIPVEGLRALLAEDNELNMEITKFMLEDYGIHVECAADGEEAVQKFKNLSWDITM